MTVTQASSAFVSRADYIGGDPYASNSSQTLHYLNKTAFARVPIGTASNEPLRPGNLGNGALRLPGQWDVDFSLGKNVPLTERLKLRVRGNFFNGLNHTNFNAISSDVTPASFGQFTGTAGARVIQLNARLTW